MAAFHGDLRLQEIVRNIAQDLHARWAIETGTFYGDSALFMAEFFAHVWTIEIREDYWRAASARFSASLSAGKITALHGRSQDLLSSVLTQVLRCETEPVFLFLDAHWQDDWPLLGELNVVLGLRKAYPGRFVVMVDDFQVPDRPDLYGTAGGGGTPGSEIYGPRVRPDPTPCDWQTFGSCLSHFLEVLFPDYPGPQPGYVLASDIPMGPIPGLKRL